MKSVGEKLDAKHSEAYTQLGQLYPILSRNCRNAEAYIIGNLTEAAEPYWDEIEALEEVAAKEGKDISVCIEKGNSKLYKLNDTTTAKPLAQIKALERVAAKSIYAAYNTTSFVYGEFVQLELEAKTCSNNKCARKFKAEFKKILKNGVPTIDEAVKNAYKYIQIGLVRKLDQLVFDSDTYVKRYTSILQNIKHCIEQN